MTWIGLQTSVLILLVGGIFLLSLMESSISRLSRLSLRVMVEKRKGSRLKLLEKISRDRNRFLLPLRFGAQVLMIAVAIFLTTLFRGGPRLNGFLFAFGIMLVVTALFRQLLPELLTHAQPERVLLKLLPFLDRLYGILLLMSAPIVVLLRVLRSSATSSGDDEDREDEAGEEEIQAYVDVGEEAGIIEEDESELIRSALEFGDTLVREIMTPRTEIVAIDEKATIEELKDLIVSSKFSRIPVYRGSLDQIVGIVYVRNLLGHLADGKGSEPITPLISNTSFVPGTKRVAVLLKEMQKKTEPMVFIINEYGSVEGMVTIEDLLEEIVGEIRDEDEFEPPDLVHESNGSFFVRGGADLEELEEALGVDLGTSDATTVSGMVVDHLGKVPSRGEQVILDGVSFEVLSTDDKRIKSLRVRKMDDPASRPLDTPDR